LSYETGWIEKLDSPCFEFATILFVYRCICR